MKATKNTINYLFILALTLSLNACKRKKDPPVSPTPPPPGNVEEVITTMNLRFTDTVTSAVIVYGFEDLDGDGGNPGGFLGTNQSDSVIILSANTTYDMEIILLDKTKNPADTISHEVEEEGKDHMFFFNSTNPTGTPYQLTLAGSGIKIIYKDLDTGSPQRGIGLKTKVKTYTATGTITYPFKITLKHQPNSKDGTLTPGDTDIEIEFKVKVN